MRLYHRTDAKDAILAEGFTDAEGDYLTERLHGGVWLSRQDSRRERGSRG